MTPDAAACFAQTYDEARRRFLAAAGDAGAQCLSYALASEAAQPLYIDVALCGAQDAPALVVSSGVHGVEGFFGSAVQLALLQQLAAERARHPLRYVLIHALNPYGFAHLRRVNEDNVDLNRNFLLDGRPYAGAPDGYAALDAFLNPPSPPSRLEPFRLKAAWNLWRTGLPALKAAVAGGQYDFPRGLFYGGKGPCASTQIVQQHCDAWLAAAHRAVHIDLHTGLGTYEMPTLLLNEAADSPHYAWYAQAFGADRIEPLAHPRGTAYQASGVFGQWMQQHFAARDYRFVGAEFGTYDVVRVLAALRAENRAHHYCERTDEAYVEAKRVLQECFCPAAATWRRQVVAGALHIIDRAVKALTVPAP